MISSKLELEKALSYEYRLYFGSDDISRYWKFRILRDQDYSQNLYHKLAYVWYLFFLKKYERRFCSEIPINVFGKGLFIWHTERIIVNPESTVGDYCSLSSALSLRRRTVGVRPWIAMWNS